MSSLSPLQVAVVETQSQGYPSEPPFDPPERYAEMPDVWHVDPANLVYAGVRESFTLLGLDAEHAATPDWNPLGDIIKPGDCVLVKPDLAGEGAGGDARAALATHVSVLRPLLDYVVVALKGKGSILIGDSPGPEADFHSAIEAGALDRVIEEMQRYARVPITIIDFRKDRFKSRNGLITGRAALNGDPQGYKVVDLKQRSRFTGLSRTRLRRLRAWPAAKASTMKYAHTNGRHAYLMPGSALRADVILNVPKLKTHDRLGLAASLRNLAGVNGSKDWLPLHSAGARPLGDAYQRRSRRKAIIERLRDLFEGRRPLLMARAARMAERLLMATARLRPYPDSYWQGSWHGNDTAWRTVHDLHEVLFHADVTGMLRETIVRRSFVLVDAVVAGEGDEAAVRPRPVGILVAGANPTAVDAVCCRLIGFDETKIPLLREAIGGRLTGGIPSLRDLRVVSNDLRWTTLLDLPRGGTLRFAPPAGWSGRIERTI